MTNSEILKAAMLVSYLPVDKMEQSFVSRVSQLHQDGWKCVEHGQGEHNILFKNTCSTRLFYLCTRLRSIKHDILMRTLMISITQLMKSISGNCTAVSRIQLVK